MADLGRAACGDSVFGADECVAIEHGTTTSCIQSNATSTSSGQSNVVDEVVTQLLTEESAPVDLHPSSSTSFTGDFADLHTSDSSAQSSSIQSSSNQSDDLGDIVGCGQEDEPMSSGELSELQKESEMPIEELLAVYGCPLQHPLDVSSSDGGCDSTSLLYSYTPGPLDGGGGESSSTCMVMRRVGEHNETYSSSEEEILTNQDLTLDKDEIARDLLMRNDTLDHETSVNDLITIIDLKSPSAVTSSVNINDRLVSGLPPLINCSSADALLCETHTINSSAEFFAEDESDDDSDDDSDDSEYRPDADESFWKKTVSIGPEFQTEIPEVVSHQTTYPAYDVDERLLWDPSRLSPTDVEMYCRAIDQQKREAAVAAGAGTAADVPVENLHSTAVGANQSIIKDDEQAMYLLLQCNYNMEEALRRKQMEVIPPSDPLSLWSNDERTSFVNGLRLYGKDFYMIQQNKVRSRSVCELVQFYYLWKKNGDQLTASLGSGGRDKKKTTTGFVSTVVSTNSDEPSTSNAPHHHSSLPDTEPSIPASPGIHSLLYTYTKHHHHAHDLPSCDHNNHHHHHHGEGDSLAENYTWPQQHSHCPCRADSNGCDFLSTLRPSICSPSAAVSVSSSCSAILTTPDTFHEPYTDSNGMMHIEPYHIDSYAGSVEQNVGTCPYQAEMYNGVASLPMQSFCPVYSGSALVAEPTSCSLAPVYYPHESFASIESHVPSGFPGSTGFSESVADFPDLLGFPLATNFMSLDSAGGPGGVFYPLSSLAVTSGVGRDGEDAGSTVESHCTQAACEFPNHTDDCSPPPAKRFKSLNDSSSSSELYSHATVAEVSAVDGELSDDVQFPSPTISPPPLRCNIKQRVSGVDSEITSVNCSETGDIEPTTLNARETGTMYSFIGSGCVPAIQNVTTKMLAQ